MNPDGDYYKRLALAVYRVTELFPEQEPLKWQIRESANKILADLLLANPSPVSAEQRKGLAKQIKIINSFFDLAGAQNWVDLRNFSVLQREYGKIEQSFEHVGHAMSTWTSHVQKPENPSVERQAKILAFLKEKQKIQIKELAQTFSEVGRRTLLRDLDGFCRTGKVVRNGYGRGIYYSVKM